MHGATALSRSAAIAQYNVRGQIPVSSRQYLRQTLSLLPAGTFVDTKLAQEKAQSPRSPSKLQSDNRFLNELSYSIDRRNTSPERERSVSLALLTVSLAEAVDVSRGSFDGSGTQVTKYGTSSFDRTQREHGVTLSSSSVSSTAAALASMEHLVVRCASKKKKKKKETTSGNVPDTAPCHLTGSKPFKRPRNVLTRENLERSNFSRRADVLWLPRDQSLFSSSSTWSSLLFGTYDKALSFFTGQHFGLKAALDVDVVNNIPGHCAVNVGIRPSPKNVGKSRYSTFSPTRSLESPVAKQTTTDSH
ncbi:hypothetical protein RvY_02180 [Ramazzottius varieornatus]|uniref:Uncharacterized protein n=1 Tax=Ramazzottius varieornatus TaxID=947166 RepID=A0A1D1UPS0_RAMVA|nr:hypothetical protein RvY_02180 [Ramazzottius varieornatus]